MNNNDFHQIEEYLWQFLMKNKEMIEIALQISTLEYPSNYNQEYINRFLEEKSTVREWIFKLSPEVCANIMQGFTAFYTRLSVIYPIVKDAIKTGNIFNEKNAQNYKETEGLIKRIFGDLMRQSIDLQAVVLGCERELSILYRKTTIIIQGYTAHSSSELPFSVTKEKEALFFEKFALHLNGFLNKIDEIRDTLSKILGRWDKIVYELSMIYSSTELDESSSSSIKEIDLFLSFNKNSLHGTIKDIEKMLVIN